MSLNVIIFLLLAHFSPHIKHTGDGDSGAFRRVRRNADPCVTEGCKWPRSSDGKVYVPYVAEKSFSRSSLRRIQTAMKTFSLSTCIRFTPRVAEEDYLHLMPLTRCSSSVGRQGGEQVVKLKEPNCIKNHKIQHELLHALGFRHEISRSDRDQHVRVLWENIEEDRKSNFKKRETLNLGTPYDFNSVMHYKSDTFSRNDLPTLEAKPSPNRFGKSKTMSQTDIDRVNKLYCTDPIQYTNLLK